MKDNKREYQQSLVSTLKSWRIKTFYSINKVDNGFLKLLQENNIIYGTANQIVDILMAIKTKEIPSNIIPRYIISDTKSFPGYKVLNDDRFKKFGFNFYQREELIRVCCFPLQAKGAVLWYRIQLPHRKIWENYPDIDCRVIFPPNYDDIHWADIVVFQRYIPGFFGLINYCKQLKKKVVFETDDLDIYISPSNPLYWEYQIGNKIQKMKAMLNIADVVTVTTNQLREEMLSFNNDICVLRNKIDIRDQIWNLPKEKNDKIIIGWVGGSSHQDDLLIVHQFVQQVCRNDDVYFQVCGYTKGGTKFVYKENKETGQVFVQQEELKRGIWDDIVDEFKRDIGDKFLIKNSLSLEEYPKFFTGIDIIVAPLQDSRFNRGKSELKIIEAGGYGIPVVASDVEPYREIITHKENGFLAKKPKDWIKYLNILIRDKELRKTMGEKLKKKIIKKYDVNDQKKRVKLYRRLVNK